MKQARILSVACPSDEEEFRQALEYLHSMFDQVRVVDTPVHAFFCSGPKNGLSLEECYRQVRHLNVARQRRTET